MKTYNYFFKILVIFIYFFILKNNVYAKPLNNTSVQLTDNIIAIINNDIITQQQLNKQLEIIQKNFQQFKQLNIVEFKKLRLQVLNQIVLEKLQLQHAKEIGLIVNDINVNLFIEQLAKINNMNITEFKNYLNIKHINWESFVNDIRNKLIITQLRQNEVINNINVSNTEIFKYLSSQKRDNNTGITPIEINIQRIILKIPLNATTKQCKIIKKQANLILQKAMQDNINFTNLVKNYSQAEANDFTNNKGETGFYKIDVFPISYQQAIVNLPPGKVVPYVLQTNRGYEIIRLVDRRSHISKNVFQTHINYILIPTPVNNFNQNTENIILHKLLKIKSQFETKGNINEWIYKNNHNDIITGDLGWINHNQMIPEFRQILDKLQVGQISYPIHTQYGYYLIIVLGHRQIEDEEIARQIISRYKYEQISEHWLQQLRNNAYVYYKLDNLL